MSLIQEENLNTEELAAEAADTAAPLAEPTKRTRKPKQTDEEKAAIAEAKAAIKAAKQAEREAKKAAKGEKAPRQTKADKFIKVLVPAAESGLRAGTGRYQFLEAAAEATKVSDLLGKEFTVGDKTVKLNAGNIQGMFSRGHVALSSDGETWERVSTTIVSE